MRQLSGPLRSLNAGCSPRVLAVLQSLTAREAALYPDYDAAQEAVAGDCERLEDLVQGDCDQDAAQDAAHRQVGGEQLRDGAAAEREHAGAEAGVGERDAACSACDAVQVHTPAA